MRSVNKHYKKVLVADSGNEWKVVKTYGELPVIPKAVAGLIENYRKNESLTYLLSDAVTFHFENSGLDWIKRHDEAVARA